MSINLINYALAKKDWKKAYEDLKVLGVGGRNLLKSSRLIRPFSNDPSSFPISYTLMTDGERQFYRIIRTNIQSHPTIMSLYNSIPVTDITQDLLGQTVTFSFRARASHNVSSNLFFYFGGGSNVAKYLSYHGSTIQITTSWKTFAFTVNIDFSIYNSDVLRFTPWQITIPPGEIDNFHLDLCEFKIELGNRATDWTLAPEDIDAHPFVAELAETIFRSKQKDWEKAYEDLKVLGVGGRNLLRNSDFSSGTDFWIGQFSIDGNKAVLQSTEGSSHYIQNTTEIPEGDYVVQIRYKVIEGQAPYLFANNETDMTILEGSESLDVADNDWNTHTVRVRVHSKSRFFALRYAASFPVDHVEGKTIISWVKLEKGNKATDWTPAPEDINAHPFVVELAEAVYRSKQNEERIRNLEI